MVNFIIIFNCNRIQFELYLIVSGAAAPGAAPAAAGVAGPPSKPGQPSSYTDIPVTNIRAVIAKRLLESKTMIPHYYLTAHCNADALIAMRAKWNKKLEKQGIRLSINDYIMKACAAATMRVPDINASWQGDKIRM